LPAFAPFGSISDHTWDVLSSGSEGTIAHRGKLDLVTPTGTRNLLSGKADVFLVRPSKAKPGTLLVAQGRDVLRVDPKSGAHETVAEQLPDSASTLVDEPSGRIWAGTGTKGLFVIEPGIGKSAAEPVGSRFGLAAGDGATFVGLMRDTVVAFDPAGAHWLDPGTDLFRGIPGFPQGDVEAVSNCDDQGNLWVALEGEHPGMPPRVGELSFVGDGVVWSPKSIEGLETVGSLHMLRIEPSSEGNVLWIGGNDSLLRVAHPDQLVAKVPRRPLLHGWVRGENGEEDEPLGERLPYATHRLRFEFASAEYGLRETLRYQTMLAGADSAWSQPTNSAELELPNLRQGSYDFRVRVLSDTGAVSEAASLKFTIAPPWWQTPWAFAGFSAGGVLALFGIYRLRVGRLRRRAAQLEQMVKLRTAELEKANAAKTEFVASMSHEIRNPMNGILGSAMALADTSLDRRQGELVATLHHCATFLASLVEDVLDFSSIESGSFTVQPEPFSPAELLDAVAAMLAEEATSSGAHFQVAIDPGLPTRVVGDSARIQQIVVNYATNALKFAGGGRIQLSARPDGEDMVFSVADNGPGIPKAEQTGLFSRFSRLKAARKAEIPGTGLGLAVCRMLAERMNGSVGVVSDAGCGATFFLKLPRVEARVEGGSSAPAAHAGGAHALVVEDIGYNADALCTMLKKLAITAEVARNGHEALALAAEGSFQFVFVDCDLPGMSGLEVARRLRAREHAVPRTFIVATTAYTTIQDREECLKAGMDAFLAKPVTPEKLKAVLEEWMRPKQAAPPVEVSNAGEGDLSLLAYLADGTRAGLDREVSRFLNSLGSSACEVLSALANKSRAGLARSAHRVASHAHLIGSTELAHAAEKLEEKSQLADFAELEKLASSLAAKIATLRETLPRHRPADKPE